MPKINEINRPYKLALCPDKRKLVLLEDTFAFLKHGADVFFDFTIALQGGLSPDKIRCQDFKSEEEKQLLFAVNWFRVMKINKDLPYLPAEELKYIFAEYYQKMPCDLVLSYLDSNLDKEQFAWVDCRKLFNKLAYDIGVNEVDLQKDVASMVQRKILLGDASAWSGCSELLGGEEKENHQLKALLFQKTISITENYNGNNSLEWKNALYNNLGLKEDSTVKDFYKLFGNNGKMPKGAKPTICNILTNIENGNNLEFTPRLKETALKSCKDKYKEKSEKTDFICNANIKKYLEVKIGEKYIEGSANYWSQMWSNALADIVPKTTRNQNFAQEKYDIKQELIQPERYDQVIEVLENYFNSEYFTGQDKFDIKKYHIGSNLKNLYEAWEKEESEEAIKNYIEEYDLDKKPQVQILRYLYTHKNNIKDKSILDTINYRTKQNKLMNLKVNPTVKGNISFTFGKSAMNGTIEPWNTQRKHIKPNGKEFGIWLTLELLDNGQWKKHHILSYNSRFYVEVFSQNDEVKKTFYRKLRFGSASKFADNKKYAEYIKNHKNKKAVKKIIRSKDSPVNGTLKDHALLFNKKNNKFEIIVTTKHSIESHSKFDEYKIGDRLLGYDQNQTAAHTYSVLEIVPKGEGFLYKDNYWKVIETGKVTSITCTGKRENSIDQLSYDGVGYGNEVFNKWLLSASAYISTLENLEIDSFDKLTNTKTKIKPTEVFNNIVKKENINLATFNQQYISILTKIIQSGADLSKIKIREEIVRMCQGSCSPLLRGSLSYVNMKALDALKRLVSSFLNRITESKEKEDLQKADPLMYNYLYGIRGCFSKRVNKREEKIRRIADFILNKAIELKVKFIAGEGDLPGTNKKNSKRQNENISDWCARGLIEKVNYGCEIHGLAYVPIDPHSTSHQQPFEHKKDGVTACMSPRFAKIENLSKATDEFLDKQLKNLKRFLKIKKKEGTTARYYRSGTIDFCKNYNIPVEEIENGMKVATFRKHMQDIEKNEVIVPMRGGRWYMSIYAVTTQKQPVLYADKSLYLCDSDEVAAINIGIAAIRNKKDPSRKP